MVKVDKWICANKLFTNNLTTKFLFFNKTSKSCEFSVKINGLLIEQRDSIRHLSVVSNDNWIGRNVWVQNCLGVMLCFVKFRY